MGILNAQGRKLTYQERFEKAMEAARRYDKRLNPEKFNGRAVGIVHGDGSHMFYRNALALRYLGLLIVFTEHHQWFVYDPNDLQSYGMFKQERIGKLKGHEVEYEELEEEENV